MLKELLKKKEFSKTINEFLKKSEVIDVVIFGSIIRGKENPEDIDLLVIYTQDVKDIIELNHQLKESLKKTKLNIEITGKRYAEVFASEFLAKESILSEGFSMKIKKYLSEGFGYYNFVLFKYSLDNKTKSERMQFYYSLYGRGNEKGLLEKNNSYKFSDRIILASIGNSEIIKNFLEKKAVKHLEFPVLIPDRIEKYILKSNIIPTD